MLSRRRFLGAAAIQAAAAAGFSSASLDSLAAAKAGSKITNANTPLNHLGRVPIIIIGSGYGSAVTALRLAEAGRPVIMLEMGRLWNEPAADAKIFTKTLFSDGRAMWFKDKTMPPVSSFLGIPIATPIQRYAGVLDRVQFDNMAVYVGRGVGGGSLVNGAMAVTPKRAYFKEVLPSVDDTEMYTKYYPLANKKLGVGVVDPNWFETTPWYKFARTSRDAAQRSGMKTVFVPSTYDLDYLKAEAAGNAPKSATNQEVIYGNNYGKKSLDKTYLADAVGTGNVTIYALQQVYHIEQLTNGDYMLKVRGIDTLGNVVSDVQLTCGALFLGAGS